MSAATSVAIVTGASQGIGRATLQARLNTGKAIPYANIFK